MPVLSSNLIEDGASEMDTAEYLSIMKFRKENISPVVVASVEVLQSIQENMSGGLFAMAFLLSPGNSMNIGMGSDLERLSLCMSLLEKEREAASLLVAPAQYSELHMVFLTSLERLIEGAGMVINGINDTNNSLLPVGLETMSQGIDALMQSLKQLGLIPDEALQA